MSALMFFGFVALWLLSGLLGNLYFFAVEKLRGREPQITFWVLVDITCGPLSIFVAAAHFCRVVYRIAKETVSNDPLK
jgi:hypothetical protein